MDFLAFILLFGGGLLMALIFMVIATRKRARLRPVLLYSSLALLCLLAQHGCWRAASDFGRATGGGGSKSGQLIVGFALGICGLWIFLLLVTLAKSPQVPRTPRGSAPPATFPHRKV